MENKLFEYQSFEREKIAAEKVTTIDCKLNSQALAKTVFIGIINSGYKGVAVRPSTLR